MSHLTLTQRKIAPALCLFTLLTGVLACDLPGQAQPITLPAESLAATAAALVLTAQAGVPTSVASSPLPATLPPSATFPPTIVVPTETPCQPTVTANTDANVRSGPGTVYSAVGAIPLGGSATVAGKSTDGTWWYIDFPAGAGGHAWVSGSVVTPSCIPASLALIAAPPTPLPASGTCKFGYVYRLARPSDKICVPPASQAQAAADNAAADSRKSVNVYGADACVSGYVWREAFSGDRVCVTSAVRSQAAADNTAAASRWIAGAYGPHTCIIGFIWREAIAGDDVCVDSSVWSQTVADNAAAASRKADADTCISGYVWREAFSGDRVCVTPAERSQVAADNAAAPSHTWP